MEGADEGVIMAFAEDLRGWGLPLAWALGGEGEVIAAGDMMDVEGEDARVRTDTLSFKPKWMLVALVRACFTLIPHLPGETKQAPSSAPSLKRY